MKGGEVHASSSWSRSPSVRSFAAEAFSLRKSNANWLPDVMLCSNPFIGEGDAVYGCGQCLLCRVNRRRVWVHRLMLENMTWSESTFITLTYSDMEVPRIGGSGLGTLVRRDLQLFLKRLRVAIAPARVRFYGVGEYGSINGRPHFHVLMFGMKGCAWKDSRLNPSCVRAEACSCASCQMVAKAWNKGFVHQGVVERKSIQYVCSYMIKRMTKVDDRRLEGREPEFAVMSRRPGIGAEALPAVLKALESIKTDEFRDDVPLLLRHGNRLMPLGRYLVDKLREARGVSGPSAGTVAKAKEKLCDLREVAALASDKEVYAPGKMSMKVFREVIVLAAREREAQLEARAKALKRSV